MKTVETILSEVYGTDAEAARVLIQRQIIRSRSAVWNWKAAGHFPARLLPVISADAEAKGVSLALADIPIHRRKQVERT